jgi:hypothetical protein
MNYIGQRTVETHNRWLVDIFHYCFGLVGNQPRETSELPSIFEFIGTNEDISNYWACSESARYCILARLRTPFGSPVQTFEAFERMFLHASSVVNLVKTGMPAK